MLIVLTWQMCRNMFNVKEKVTGYRSGAKKHITVDRNDIYVPGPDRRA